MLRLNHVKTITALALFAAVVLGLWFVIKLNRPLVWTMVNVNYSPQQGDAHLIQTSKGKTILIDAAHLAPARNALVPYLQLMKVKHLEAVFITHPHKDHYLGLLAILENGISIDTVYMNDVGQQACIAEMPYGCDFDELFRYRTMLKVNKVKLMEAKAGNVIDLGWFSRIKILYAFDGVNTPVGKTDINDMSLVMRLEQGFNSVLFTGDLNAKMGAYLAKNGQNLKADILKMPHHGTEGAPPDAFYEAVSPKAALVPSPALLWCSPRSARMKNWVESQRIPTYVNGFTGHVNVKMSLFGYQIEPERVQTRLHSFECPVQ